MKLKRSTIALISSALFLTTSNIKVFSCGWESPYAYSGFNDLLPPDISFILSEFGDDFYLNEYSYKTHSGGYNSATKKSNTDKSINLEEWKDYIGGDVDKRDIEKVIYHYTEQQLADILEQIIGDNIEKKAINNSCIQCICDQKKTDLLEYISRP